MVTTDFGRKKILPEAAKSCNNIDRSRERRTHKGRERHSLPDQEVLGKKEDG